MTSTWKKLACPQADDPACRARRGGPGRRAGIRQGIGASANACTAERSYWLQRPQPVLAVAAT